MGTGFAPDREDAPPVSTSASTCWHFDAISDDGREVVLITFHDHYAYSSRRIRAGGMMGKSSSRLPAVTLTYAVDGKPLVRALNLFSNEQFSLAGDDRECRIGECSFSFDAARYGTGFLLKLDLVTPRRCRMTAEIEWVNVDPQPDLSSGSDAWRLVSTRSDVSGLLSLYSRRDRSRTDFHFRGTGYHDRFADFAGDDAAPSRRRWARAHFLDSSVAAEARQGRASPVSDAKLVVIRNGVCETMPAVVEEQNLKRDRYGLKLPTRMLLTAENNVRLEIKPISVVESGFFRKVMLSEMILNLSDGKARRAMGLIEFVEPARLGNPVLKVLSEFGVRRNQTS